MWRFCSRQGLSYENHISEFNFAVTFPPKFTCLTAKHFSFILLPLKLKGAVVDGMVLEA